MYILVKYFVKLNMTQDIRGEGQEYYSCSVILVNMRVDVFFLWCRYMFKEM